MTHTLAASLDASLNSGRMLTPPIFGLCAVAAGSMRRMRSCYASSECSETRSTPAPPCLLKCCDLIAAASASTGGVMHKPGLPCPECQRNLCTPLPLSLACAS